MTESTPPFFEVQETGSTNDLARERLGSASRSSGPDLVVVAAGRQTRGRGRLGRGWVSPEGGAWLSLAGFVGRAVDVPARSLAAAVVAAELCEHWLGGGIPVRIRWPNDLLIGNRKAGGMLGEVVTVRGRPALVLGVGINVNNPIEPEPGSGAFRTPATSLAIGAGRPIDLHGFRALLIEHLIDSWRAFDRRGFDAATRGRLDDRLAYRGRVVRLRTGTRHAEGALLGVDPAGALLLEIDGAPTRFVAGEVSCRPADEPAR